MSKAAQDIIKNLLWLIDEGILVESEPSPRGPLLVGEARAYLEAAQLSDAGETASPECEHGFCHTCAIYAQVKSIAARSPDY